MIDVEENTRRTSVMLGTPGANCILESARPHRDVVMPPSFALSTVRSRKPGR